MTTVTTAIGAAAVIEEDGIRDPGGDWRMIRMIAGRTTTDGMRGRGPDHLCCEVGETPRLFSSNFTSDVEGCTIHAQGFFCLGNRKSGKAWVVLARVGSGGRSPTDIWRWNFPCGVAGLSNAQHESTLTGVLVITS